MGYQFFRRPITNLGIRDISGGGLIASTKGLALTTGTFSTGTSITLGAFFKTSGTIIPNRVVKLSSAGNIRHTTGTSGRPAIGVALTSATTAQVALHGIVFLQVSTAAVKRGALLQATSGAISTGSQLGGTVKAAITNTVDVVGRALTSAAAGAGARKILAYLNPGGRYSSGS